MENTSHNSDPCNKRKLDEYQHNDNLEDQTTKKPSSIQTSTQKYSEVDWSPFKCRKAEEGDIQMIINLIAEILVEYNVTPSVAKAKKSVSKDIRMLQANYFAKGGSFDVIVADAEENTSSAQIIGLVSVLPRSNGVVDLKRLYVLKSFRKLGLGHKLMQHALNKAKDMQAARVDLVVYKVHSEAIQLYHKYGFKEWQPNGKSPKDIFMRLELKDDSS